MFYTQIVPGKPLRDIFIREQLGDNQFFDFYFLDIEGAELTALESVDVNKVSFGPTFVESSGGNLSKDMAIRAFLE